MKKITNEMIRSFKDHLINEEKSLATIEKYIRDITALKQWSKDKEITKQLLLDYKKELIENYAPVSVNSIISSLNSFFDFNNMHSMRLKSIRIQKQIFLDQSRELTYEEYKSMLKVAREQGNKRLFYLMQTICSTGIRVSELKYITAEAVRNGQAVIKCKGKMRMVILPHKLCKLLKKYMHETKISCGSLFISKNGKPLDRSNIWAEMKKLCEAAGVDRRKVFPHNLRHLFARTFYTMQKDVVRLADILGHSSVNTTRIYTMETGEIHRKKIQELGLLLC